jgi:hypothetical protein
MKYGSQVKNENIAVVVCFQKVPLVCQTENHIRTCVRIYVQHVKSWYLLPAYNKVSLSNSADGFGLGERAPPFFADGYSPQKLVVFVRPEQNIITEYRKRLAVRRYREQVL